MKKFLLFALMLLGSYCYGQEAIKLGDEVTVNTIEGVPMHFYVSQVSTSGGNKTISVNVGYNNGAANGSWHCIDSLYEGKVTVPATVTINDTVCKVVGIQQYAFYKCSRVTEIAFEDPATIASIGVRAFQGDSALKTFSVPSGVFTIPNYCFLACTSLESIVLPEKLASIGTYAFRYCSALKSIDIPSANFGATGLGTSTSAAYTFADCSGLESVTLPTPLTQLPRYVFQNCSSLKSITIPEKVTAIGFSAFEKCSGLAEVSFASLTTMPATGLGTATGTSNNGKTFEACTSLKKVTLPTSLTTLPYRCFYGCTALEEVNWEGDGKVLGNYAFRGCQGLAKDGVLTIPANIGTYGTYCYNTINFSTVICLTPALVAYKSSMFTVAQRNAATLYVPADLVDTYKATANWKSFSNIYPLATVPEGALKIDDTFTPQVAKWVRTAMTTDNPGIDGAIIGLGYVTTDMLNGVTRLVASNTNTTTPTYTLGDADIANIGERFPNLSYLELNNPANTDYTYAGNRFDHFKPTNAKLDTVRIDRTFPITVDMSGCPDLKRLSIIHSYTDTVNIRMTDINLTNNSKLHTLIAYPSKLTSIDLSHCTELVRLELNNHNLTELDLSKNTKLEYLYSWRGNGSSSTDFSVRDGLKKVDISNCHDLLYINLLCHHIEELDVSNCTKLQSLIVRYNDIHRLDLSKNEKTLTAINVGNNHLRSLDLSQCKDTVWSSIVVGGLPLNSIETVQTDVAAVRQLSGNRIGVFMPADVDESRVTAVLVDGVRLQKEEGDTVVNRVEFEKADGKNYLVVGDGTYDKDEWESKTVRYYYHTQTPATNMMVKVMYVDLTLEEETPATAEDIFIPSIGLAEDGKYYASMYYGDKALTVPQDVTAYTYKVVDGELTVSHTYAAGDVIPAGQAVILAAEDNDTYTFEPATTEGTADNSSMLMGSDEQQTFSTSGYMYFMLSTPPADTDYDIGFWWQVDGGKSIVNGAHKAFLRIPEAQAAGVKGFSFTGNTTGISSINNEQLTINNSSAWYTLDGRKLNTQPTQKGIYIHNGKKVVIK